MTKHSSSYLFHLVVLKQNMKKAPYSLPFVLVLIFAGLIFLSFTNQNSVIKSYKAPWRNLLNDKDLTGWDKYIGPLYVEKEGFQKNVAPLGLNNDPQQVFSIVTVDGGSALHVSGEQFGGVSTQEEFENYHLQLQFKWGKLKWAPKKDAKMDSGILYHANGPHGADGGFWMQSQEFQVQEGDTGDYWGVAGGAFDVTVKKEGEKDWIYYPKGTLLNFSEKSPNGRHCIRSANFEKPSGEWNTVDIYCFGGTAVHMINGKVNMVLQNSKRIVGDIADPLTKGKIQLQSEGAEVYYRNIRIQPIHKIPASLLK